MWTITKIYNRTCDIIRGHICMYHLIVIIITVLRLFFLCTIATFIEMDVILSFVVIFRWFWEFSNYMIYISAYKTFARWELSLLYSQITSRASFLIILSYLIFLKYFPVGSETPQKVHYTWTGFDLSLFLPEPELMSRFK